jgi:hypothetical protein
MGGQLTHPTSSHRRRILDLERSSKVFTNAWDNEVPDTREMLVRPKHRELCCQYQVKYVLVSRSPHVRLKSARGDLGGICTAAQKEEIKTSGP